jgi:glucose/arabinose dehydrogenase
MITGAAGFLGTRLRDTVDDQRAKPQRIINRAGSIPKDNPFAGKDDSAWSGGHRNKLAAVHPSTGQLWVVEMGPRGGDELNLVERGANYAWPAVSNGDNYDKSPIPAQSCSGQPRRHSPGRTPPSCGRPPRSAQG